MIHSLNEAGLKTECGIEIQQELIDYSTGKKLRDSQSFYHTYIDVNGTISTGWYPRIHPIRDVKPNMGITCPQCIEEMKKRAWHCEVHGFVGGEEVTFDEKCAYCGKDV